MLSGSLLNTAPSQLSFVYVTNAQCPTFVIHAEAKDQTPANVYNWEDQLKNEISFN